MQPRILAASGGVAGIVAVAIAALLGSLADQARADALTPAHLAEDLAALRIVDDAVEHHDEQDLSWGGAVDGMGLQEGDWLRTDGAGFAEVLWADGSLTRLDGGTEFGVTLLAQEAVAPHIRTRLDVGRVWNRVQDVTGQRGSFSVETAVGTATVRGTVFIVECDLRPVCTFTVLDGVVEVATLDGRLVRVEAGEELTLGIDGRDGQGPVVAGGGDEGDEGDQAGGGTGGDGTGGDGTGGDGTGGDGGEPAGFPGGPVDDPVEPFSLAPDESIVVTDRRSPGVASLSIGGFATRNRDQNRSDGVDPTEDRRCAVTIDGRNAALASTPDTAIDVSVDDVVVLDAVATGPLERYAVDVELADLSFVAASGEVQPNADGDRTTFRGRVDAGKYAAWGAGLYRVRATTTGTACDVVAFVNVTGGSPLLTAPTIGALLLLIGGAAALTSSLSRTATLATTTSLTSLGLPRSLR